MERLSCSPWQDEEAPLPSCLGLRKARKGKTVIQVYPSEMQLELYVKTSLEKAKAAPGAGSSPRSRQHPLTSRTLAVRAARSAQGFAGFSQCCQRTRKYQMLDTFFFFSFQVLVCTLVSTVSPLLIILHKVACSNSVGLISHCRV